jgi:hypothetical protein
MSYVLMNYHILGGINVEKMTKKERREMIAAAMKTIAQQETLTPAARERGLKYLMQAYKKATDSKE